MAETYKLVLLRHGQSEWNKENLFTGWVDVPLSEQGRAEAKKGGALLKERGIVVEEVTREAAGDYESLITVTVTTEKQTRAVSGTVFADGRPRLVNIKGIRMDAEFGPSMVYITNLDKPGFIGKFSSTLGEAGINIATFHLGRVAPGSDAIALVEVDGAVPADLLAKVQALPQVKQAKALTF